MTTPHSPGARRRALAALLTTGAAALVTALLAACASAPAASTTGSAPAPAPAPAPTPGAPGAPSPPGAPWPVTSLLGQALTPPATTPDDAARLAAASEDAFIWLGRRLSYEYRYHQAVHTYTAALARFPDSHRLLRHRGHRYITLRDFDRAVDDLTRAQRLAAHLPDALEPDGAPNAAGIPRSTTRGNIQYHLALAHYLRGEFAEAARQWAAGLELATNDDSVVSSSWWLALSLRRAGGQVDGAPALDEVLAPIRAQMDILENHAYQRLLLLAKGELSEAELLPSDAGDVASTTISYGVAAWRLGSGDEQGGLDLCRAVAASPSWMAFGCIAAEAELWRRGLDLGTGGLALGRRGPAPERGGLAPGRRGLEPGRRELAPGRRDPAPPSRAP